MQVNSGAVKQMGLTGHEAMHTCRAASNTGVALGWQQWWYCPGAPAVAH
jgi:hypothetical protein